MWPDKRNAPDSDQAALDKSENGRGRNVRAGSIRGLRDRGVAASAVSTNSRQERRCQEILRCPGATDHYKRGQNSTFKAILNEKDPPPGDIAVDIPPSFRAQIVSERVNKLRSHPDFRIARRGLIISRLAQVISERKVQGGLRRVLLIQAKRLQWLANRRYEAMGGALSVAKGGEDDD